MAAYIPLRWTNGQKQSRAPQISAETWRTHETTIHELYKQKTLAELMGIMKNNYNFEATIRQYTFRLRQWGFHKQAGGLGKEPQKEDGISRLIGDSDPKRNDMSSHTIRNPSSENLKRQRSSHSIGSQSSTEFAPISKRLKRNSEENRPNIGTTWNSEDSSPELSPSTASEDSQSVASSTSSVEVTNVKSIPQNVSTITDDDHLWLFGVEQIGADSCPSDIPGDSDFIDWFLPPESNAEPKPHVASEERRAFSGQPLSPHPSSFPTRSSPRRVSEGSLTPTFTEDLTLEFCLELSRKLDGFPDLSSDFELPRETEDRLKVVADRLFAIDQFQAASNIYSILLVTEESAIARMVESRTLALPLLTPRLISAARSARTLSQCQFVEDVLLSRLEPSRCQDVSTAEYFIVHTLLADCYIQQGRSSMSFRQQKRSWDYAQRVSQQGDPALKQDLSILAYLYYKRVFPEIPDSSFLSIGAINDKCFRLGLLAAQGTTPLSHDDLLAFCMLAKNPKHHYEATQRHETHLIHRIAKCIKDCVEWCRLILEDADFEVHRSALALTLFERAWKVWQQQSASARSWAIASEEEVRIPAAEHLRICIDILCVLGTEGSASSSTQILVRLYLEILLNRTAAPVGQQQISQSLSKSLLRRSSHDSTTISSFGSSNKSLRDFLSVARSMRGRMVQSVKRHVVEEPTIAARGSQPSRSSLGIGLLDDVRQLSAILGGARIQERDENEP